MGEGFKTQQKVTAHCVILTDKKLYFKILKRLNVMS